METRITHLQRSCQNLDRFQIGHEGGDWLIQFMRQSGSKFTGQREAQCSGESPITLTKLGLSVIVVGHITHNQKVAGASRGVELYASNLSGEALTIVTQRGSAEALDRNPKA